MVEYLEIFGKKYPVRIGYYVMKKVKEKTGISFSEALQKAEKTGDLEIHETILFAALQMGAYAEEKDMDSLDISPEEMPMILDSCFGDYLTLFTSESFFPKELQEELEKKQQDREKNKPKRGKTPKSQ